LIKYIKSVLWAVAKCLPYIEDTRCLKVKMHHAWLCGYNQMAACCDVTMFLHLLWCIWVDKMHYLVGKKKNMEA